MKKTKTAERLEKEARDRQTAGLLNPIIVAWEGQWPDKRYRKACHAATREAFLAKHPLNFATLSPGRQKMVCVQASPWSQPK